MKKRLVVVLGILFIIFLCNFISAADVAYVLKKTSRADSGFIDVFSDMGLSVELIEDKNVGDVDFSDYKFIFVGDERLRNLKYISVDDIPGVIVNSKYAKQFGFLDKGRVSKLASNAKLKIKKNGDIVEVYERARFRRGGVGVPYYYLRNKYKNKDVESVATTYTKRNKELGDVISYLEFGGIKKCFFGISETKYWTDEARELFEECVSYVVEGEPAPEPEPEPSPEPEPGEPVCFENIDCGEDEYISDRYCGIDENVYQDYKRFECLNPGIAESYCSNLTEPELIEECSFGCLDGECLAEEPEPEPIPDPGEVHDVGLVENYDEFNHIIRLKNPSNEVIEEDVPQLQCNQEYDFQFRIINNGDVIDDVEINLTIMNLTDIVFNQFKTKTDLGIGIGTTTGNKNNLNFNFESGFYSVLVEVGIVDFSDDNLLDNTATREIEIVCA